MSWRPRHRARYREYTVDTSPPPQILFYIPEKRYDYTKFPTTVNDYWMTSDAVLKEGKYIWTLQTYLYLREAHYSCKLSPKLDQGSIIITHRDFLPAKIIPSKNQLFVCIKADRDAHPFAQIHIIQNIRDRLDIPPFSLLWASHYITHWPQGRLIPRAKERNDAFENIAYFGVDEELGDELKTQSWVERLKQIGLIWHPVYEKDKWHDYSYVDAVVALRNPFKHYDHKPPSKLHNAWRAGVPAILGPESAYIQERKSHLDYIEARSADEAFLKLRELRDNKSLRTAIADHGRARAKEVCPERIVEQWISFIDNVAIPAYYRWHTASVLERWSFYFRRLVRYMRVTRVYNR